MWILQPDMVRCNLITFRTKPTCMQGINGLAQGFFVSLGTNSWLLPAQGQSHRHLTGTKLETAPLCPGLVEFRTPRGDAVLYMHHKAGRRRRRGGACPLTADGVAYGQINPPRPPVSQYWHFWTRFMGEIRITREFPQSTFGAEKTIIHM